MPLLSFGHLWKNQEHSDVDVVLTVLQHSQDADQQQQSTQLARFPGHSVLLSSSPMVSAQILRWQHHHKAADEPPPKKRRARRSAVNHTTSSTDDSSSRPQLVLELQDQSEEAAALTVLQSLYGTAPLEQLLAQLRQEQLLQAAILADKWQVPDVSTAAVQALPRDNLSTELLQQFVQLPAVPTFLLPLLGPVTRACIRDDGAGAGMTEDARQLLLSVLGDLEEVLGDAALREALLALRPRAMRLLLSCSDLKVASEDTVLAAAREYVKAHKSSAAAVAGMLAPLVRCQHLSMYWLTACALRADEGLSALFSPLKKQLKRLMLMRLADSSFVPSEKELQQHFEGAPDSWLKGRRTVREVDSVQLVWPLPIADLRSLVQRSTDEKRAVQLKCPLVSAPLGGMTWSLLLEAVWDAEDEASYLNMFCIPKNGLRNFWYRHRWQIDVEGAPVLTRSMLCSHLIPGLVAEGSGDVFDAGYMVGWDEEAWAATGLPTEGELLVTLTVTAVNNTGRHAMPA